jgi:hypothetical protein
VQEWGARVPPSRKYSALHGVNGGVPPAARAGVLQSLQVINAVIDEP